MKNFELEPRLADGNIKLGKLSACQVLLVNNSKVPWFILVPSIANVSEIYELDENTQQQVMKDINDMSRFVKNHFGVDKLNVAAIGNIVKQLHIHVVGRYHDDYAWPGVIWGRSEHADYSSEEISAISEKFKNSFE